MRSRHFACALACLATGLALVPQAASAGGTGKVSGRLTGVAVPAAADGAAVVQAVRLDTGRIAATRRLPASGAYALTLPSGPYVLVATVLDPSAGVLRTTTGRPLMLRAHQRRAVAVGAAASGHVIDVGDFSGASGRLAGLNRGLPVVLQGAMSAAGGGCPGAYVANARQRAALPGQPALRRSRYGDRHAKLRRAFASADALVTGTLITSDDGSVSYEIRIADARARVRDVLRGQLRATSGFVTQVDALAAQLARRICTSLATAQPPPDPAVLTGTFSGTADYTTAQDGIPVMLRWSGTVTLERHAPDDAGVVIYTLRSGTANVTIGGRYGSCGLEGSVSVDLIQTNPGGAPPALTIDPGPVPGYRVVLQSATGEIVARTVDCKVAAANGDKVPWPLLGVALGFTPDPLTAPSRSLFSASLSGRPAAPDPLQTWQWSLAPPG